MEAAAAESGGGAVAAPAEAVAASISSVDGCVVTVRTAIPVAGAVYLTADQSRADNTCRGKACHHHRDDDAEQQRQQQQPQPPLPRFL